MIRLNSLHKSVPGKEILRDVSCEIHEGLTFIVGDSGAGKSTLLNMIGTLDDFSSGEIIYENKGEQFSYSSATEQETEAFRSRHIGFIFQASNLIDGLNCIENVELSMHLAGKEADSDSISASLKKLGLTEPEKSVDVFSGGEKQRVAIARALVKGADIILADEPTGNLDSGNTDKVFSLLKDISQGRHVLVVTHNEEKARQYADRILVVQDGRIVQDEMIHGTIPQGLPFDGGEMPKNSGGIPRSFIHKMSQKNICRFKGKFFSMALVLGLAFALVAGLIAVHYYLDDEINNLNYTYFDADFVNIYYEPSEGARGLLSGPPCFGKPFSEEQIAYFQGLSDFAEVVPIVFTYFYTDNYKGQLDIKQIQLNDFFRNRIMTDSVEGSFPKNNGEIILGEDVAGKVFEGNCIGREFSMRDINGNTFSYTVVGINHQKNVDGIYYSYVSAESIKENIFYRTNASVLIHKSSYDQFVEEKKENFSVPILGSGIVSVTEEEAFWVYGKNPSESNEIAISIDLFSDIYYDLSGDYHHFRISEFEEMDNFVKEALALVTGIEYYLPINDLYIARVSAVHNGDDTAIFVSRDWYDVITPALPQRLQCYTGNMDISKKFNAEDMPGEYYYESYYHERFAPAVETTKEWTLLMVCIVVVVILLVGFLTVSFARISISERTYEIGVIKALGAGRKSLYKMLLQDQLYLGAVSGIMAAVFYVLFVLLLPLVTKHSMSNWFVIIISLIALVFVPVVVCILFSTTKIRKAMKSKPVDDIRKRM